MYFYINTLYSRSTRYLPAINNIYIYIRYPVILRPSLKLLKYPRFTILSQYKGYYHPTERSTKRENFIRNSTLVALGLYNNFN